MADFSGSDGSEGPPPLSEFDKQRLRYFAREAFELLCDMEDRTMALGDVCAELRAMDCESHLLDEVIIFMLQSRLIELFKEKHSDDCWMRALPSAHIGFLLPPTFGSS